MTQKAASSEFITEYFQITDLWKRLCELHNDLFDKTAEEYSHLLSSNFEEIERVTVEKNEVITEITSIDNIRQDLIAKLRDRGAKIEKANDLVKYFQDCPPEASGKHLWRFNQLLVDIIEKIQDQNKKNQIFINKAIISLKEIRQGALGESKHFVYNSKGGQKAINTHR